MAETASITPSLAGRVWLKSIRHPDRNRVVTVADYGDIEHAMRSGIFPVEGRALPTGVEELAGGRDHVLVLATDNKQDEDHLAVTIRLGGVFFIHVPTVPGPGIEGNTLLPGSMYVMFGRPVKRRLGGVSRVHHHILPLVEVAAPGPDVVGTTITVAGLLELHGSIEALWAAYPTIRDLWAEIGSGESLLPI
jgi:hypothetical protein